MAELTPPTSQPSAGQGFPNVDQTVTTSEPAVESQPGPNLYQEPSKNIFSRFGQSRAYFVEYALVLLFTGTLLGVITTMLGTILTDHSKSGLFDSFAYTVSIAEIATLLVVAPAILFFTKRTNTLEDLTPEIKNKGWRKGFLGIFLIIVSLYSLGYTIALTYQFISYFASFGLGSDASTFPWRAILQYGLIGAMFSFTAWLYAHDYRNQESSKTVIARIHHYGLIVFAVVLTLIYLGTAFKQQRGVFIDNAITGDLRDIQSKVSAYESKNYKLPADLAALDLNDKQKSRSKAFNYEYKKGSGKYTLCAEFKTDSRDSSASGANPLEAFSGSSYGSSYGKSDVKDDPGIHSSGRECFDTDLTPRDIYNGSSLQRSFENDLNAQDSSKTDYNASQN